jgi:hypothetical protein
VECSLRIISGIVKAVEVVRGRRGSVKLGAIESSSSSSESEGILYQASSSNSSESEELGGEESSD